MVKKTPEREAANDAFADVLDVNERILKEIHEAYTRTLADVRAPPGSTIREPKLAPALLKPEKEGIMEICLKLGLSCIAPRRKINVMVVGNHSAGKSSYINWYIGEHVQSTAVAIETQGFTFITSGKKRDTLKGQATLQLFQHLQHELSDCDPSIYNWLQTEVSTSKEKCFGLITFIDTPGLVDGSFQYRFPVEDAIQAVARHCDLIYIFFDPIGQALCDRTMKVVERLNLDYAEKMRFFLSKADTVPNERDRQKVVVQITQNLSSRVRNVHAFELPSMFIPSHIAGSCKIENSLEGTCDEMQATINQSVQNNLNKLEVDCRAISKKIDALLAADATVKSSNFRAASYGYLSLLLSLNAPLLVLACVLHRARPKWLDPLVASAPGVHAAFGEAFDTLVGTGAQAGDEGAEGLLSMQQFMAGAAAVFVVFQIAAKLLRRRRVPAFSSREVANLRGTQRYVMGELMDTKVRLYKLYLDQCSSELQ